MVWKTLCVDEIALGSGESIYYGSLARWCYARGRHIRELKILLAKGKPHVRGWSPVWVTMNEHALGVVLLRMKLTIHQWRCSNVAQSHAPFSAG